MSKGCPSTVRPQRDQPFLTVAGPSPRAPLPLPFAGSRGRRGCFLTLHLRRVPRTITRLKAHSEDTSRAGTRDAGARLRFSTEYSRLANFPDVRPLLLLALTVFSPRLLRPPRPITSTRLRRACLRTPLPYSFCSSGPALAAVVFTLRSSRGSLTRAAPRTPLFQTHSLPHSIPLLPLRPFRASLTSLRHLQLAPAPAPTL